MSDSVGDVGNLVPLPADSLGKGDHLGPDDDIIFADEFPADEFFAEGAESGEPAADLAGQAGSRLRTEVSQTLQSLAGKVEQKPISAVLFALGLGYIFSRIVTRRSRYERRAPF